MNHQSAYPSQDPPTSSCSSVDAWALRYSALPPRLELPPREPPEEPPEKDAQTCGSDLASSPGWPVWPPIVSSTLPPTFLPTPAIAGTSYAGRTPYAEAAARDVLAAGAAVAVAPLGAGVLAAPLPGRSSGSCGGCVAPNWNR